MRKMKRKQEKKCANEANRSGNGGTAVGETLGCSNLLVFNTSLSWI